MKICINCIFSKFLTWLPERNAYYCTQWKGGSIGGELISKWHNCRLNWDGKCKYYKRKWWKFWIRDDK